MRTSRFAPGVAALIAALVVSGTASAASTPRRHAGMRAGTVTFAEGPGSAPNYIFPFEGLAQDTQANTAQFQQLMYRPLYWFGNGAAPTLNLKYSLAKAPVYSNGNKTVTIGLNDYRWSNGEQVTTQNIVFFLNLYRADPGAFYGYAPGAIPSDIVSARAASPTKLVLHLAGPVNSYWFTYNELSQITPLPLAWDVTSLHARPGSAACAASSFDSVVAHMHLTKGAPSWTPASAAARSCDAVYDFLSTESGYNPTGASPAKVDFVTSPLWSVVDGPWKLQSYSSSGDIVFTPNASYSGPDRPTYSRFVEQAFTSTTAEATSLLAGDTAVGYLPAQDIISPATSATRPGANLTRLSSYAISAQPGWSIAYALYNFASTNDGGQAGRLISELYIRQALQSLVDQPLFVHKILHGYGSPTYGPVPVLPKNPFATRYETTNPYPYSPARAHQLLASHGWRIVPGGTDVCESAKACGVPKGTKLALTMAYGAGNPALQQEVTAEDAAWASLGISVALRAEAFNEVASESVPSNHHWDLADYGVWIYQPDYYPTGEALFETGAGANAGSYSDPRADTLIKATDFSPNSAYFATYENYLAKQLPYLWQPTPVLVDEISKQLSGVAPISAVGTILPETWHRKR